MNPAITIVLARTAQDAFQVLQAGLEPSVIILDLPPDQSGYQVLEIMRCDTRWKSLPVIVFTVEDGDILRPLCSRLGALRYATKPNTRAGFADFVTFLEPWLGSSPAALAD